MSGDGWPEQENGAFNRTEKPLAGKKGLQTGRRLKNGKMAPPGVELRIPTKPAIYSDRNQPPVPIEASQAFRRKPAGVAAWSEGGDIRLRSQRSRQAWALSRHAVCAMIRP